MSKQLRKLRKRMSEYMDKIIIIYLEFKKIMEEYFEKGMEEDIKKNLEIVSAYEEEADTIRREIIRFILKSDFMPTTVISFMNLCEMLDKIADKSEKISNTLLFKILDKNDIDINIIKNILSITEGQLKKLAESVDYIFEDYDKAFDIAHYLEIPEKEIDVIEKIFMNHLQESEMELAKKIYYKDLVESITSISDLIEDIGDEIEKITILGRA